MSMPPPYTHISKCNICFGDGLEPVIMQQQPIEIIKKRLTTLFDLGKCDSCNGTGKKTLDDNKS